MGQKDSAALLGTESIGRLLLKYSAPAIVGQIAASLYNIVDSVFIGQGVGEMAISGLDWPWCRRTGSVGLGCYLPLDEYLYGLWRYGGRGRLHAYLYQDGAEGHERRDKGALQRDNP